MQRVEHRVAVKKDQAGKLEKELSQAQLAAGRGIKRRLEPNHSKVNLTQVWYNRYRVAIRCLHWFGDGLRV